MYSKFNLKKLKLDKNNFLLFFKKYCNFSKKEIIIKLAFFLLFAIPFIIDKVIKSIIFNKLFEGSAKSIIPKIFSFSYQKNSGIAGGILSNQNLAVLIITVTFIIIIFVFFIFVFSKNITLACASLLVFSGGLDNLTDRFVFDNAVIDYIVLLNSNFACNIGDGLIFGGIFCLLAWSLIYLFIPDVKKINVEPTKIL